MVILTKKLTLNRRWAFAKPKNY